MAVGNGFVSSTRRSGSSLNKTLLSGSFLVTLFLLFQISREIPASFHLADYLVQDDASIPKNLLTTVSTIGGWDPTNPLGVPRGKAENLPSIRAEDDKRDVDGLEVDLGNISPEVWKHMVTKLGVKSVLDVGCGRGISSLWFYRHGLDVLCVESSHDAVASTVLPDPKNQLVEHDFSRGPWWPEQTYSACWVVDFLEHVSYVQPLIQVLLYFAKEMRLTFTMQSFCFSGYSISSTF